MGFLDSLRKATKALSLVPGCTTNRDGQKVLRYTPTYTAFRIFSAVKQYRIHINGLNHIEKGPAWVVAKHTHDKDIPDLSSALFRKTGSAPYFVAKKELAGDPWERAQYQELGAIFIDREHPSPSTLKEIMEKVRQGSQVVIFPEGTRKPGEIGHFNEGAAMMASALHEKQRINAPIYCVGISRPSNMKRGAYINISPPMFVTDFEGKGKEKRKLMTEAMKRTVSLLCSKQGKEARHLKRRELLENIVKGIVKKGRKLIPVAHSVRPAHI